MNGNQLSAYGITKARVKTVKMLYDSDEEERASVALHNLRQLKPLSGGLARESREWQATLLKYCVLFENYFISEYHPLTTPFLTAKDCMRLLEVIWSTEEDVIQLTDETKGGRLILRFLSQCWNTCIGRSFFHRGRWLHRAWSGRHCRRRRYLCASRMSNFQW